jgi:hypothetical protein
MSNIGFVESEESVEMIIGEESESGVVSEGIYVELSEIWIGKLALTPETEADLLGASKYSL